MADIADQRPRRFNEGTPSPSFSRRIFSFWIHFTAFFWAGRHNWTGSFSGRQPITLFLFVFAIYLSFTGHRPDRFPGLGFRHLILKGLYDSRIPLWESLNLNVLAICIIFSCIVSRASIASNVISARQSGELLIIFISNVTLQSCRTTPLSWLLMAFEKTRGNYRRVWGPWYDAV